MTEDELASPRTVEAPSAPVIEALPTPGTTPPSGPPASPDDGSDPWQRAVDGGPGIVLRATLGAAILLLLLATPGGPLEPIATQYMVLLLLLALFPITWWARHEWSRWAIEVALAVGVVLVVGWLVPSLHPHPSEDVAKADFTVDALLVGSVPPGDAATTTSGHVIVVVRSVDDNGTTVFTPVRTKATWEYLPAVGRYVVTVERGSDDATASAFAAALAGADRVWMLPDPAPTP